jgi:CheY-like chemotaxis protein
MYAAAHPSGDFVARRTMGRDQPEALEASLPVVLVVDDVVLVRTLIADSLRARGFDVVEAGSGEEAICILEAGLPVQAILTDVYMPAAEVDGLGLARWLRRHRPGVKLLLGSGMNLASEAVDKGLHDGPILLKPYDYDYLDKALRVAVP